MNDRWDTFDRIWGKGKNGKMRMRLMEKVKIRGLDPTEENCRDYWMGYIRYYDDAYTGRTYHVNPRKNKSLMKTLRRHKQYATERGREKGKRKSHPVGRQSSKKNRNIRRR